MSNKDWWFSKTSNKWGKIMGGHNICFPSLSNIFGNPWISRNGKQIFTVNIYFRLHEFLIGIHYNQLGKIICVHPFPMILIRIQLPYDFKNHD